MFCGTLGSWEDWIFPSCSFGERGGAGEKQLRGAVVVVVVVVLLLLLPPPLGRELVLAVRDATFN